MRAAQGRLGGAGGAVGVGDDPNGESERAREGATPHSSLPAPSPSLRLSVIPSVQPEQNPALLLQVTSEVKVWEGRGRRRGDRGGEEDWGEEGGSDLRRRQGRGG